ncbi:uncharacterized protein RBU33_017296 isoform 1-T1 [Hipposideros larvatus]
MGAQCKQEAGPEENNVLNVLGAPSRRGRGSPALRGAPCLPANLQLSSRLTWKATYDTWLLFGSPFYVPRPSFYGLGLQVFHDQNRKECLLFFHLMTSKTGLQLGKELLFQKSGLAW